MMRDQSRSSLRLWPGVLIVAVQWLARFALPVVYPDLTMYAVMAGFGGGFALVVWWLFFSRAAWVDRLGAVALMIASMAASRPLLDQSLATGAMGMMYLMLAMPGLCLAFVIALLATRHSSPAFRRVVVGVAIVIAAFGWMTVKTGGFTGTFDNDLSWRWTPTPEERLLAQRDDTPPVPATPAPAATIVAAEAPTAPTPESRVTAAAVEAVVAAPAINAALDWPGFRGAERDGVVRGVRIATDWSASPPKERWRRPIGPGWSSFSVHGDVFFTQEQRGPDEIIAAYRVSTGAPVWKHRDAARFWESNGGPGPRGTPTLSNGRVYAIGATGILNVLDEATGRVIWSRNAATDTKTKLPDWGFSSSPLLIDDLVIVAVAGKLAAYDMATGAQRWTGPDGGNGYSSPHLLTVQGEPQILLLDGKGATSVSPADGSTLWSVTLTTSGMSAPIVQPAITADGDLLITAGDITGVHRVALAKNDGKWSAISRWSTNGLKPYFNDFVVHEGHAYGFDGTMLAAIDVADGKRKWKGGRYGNGQLVLLPEQDVLIVITEDGELALVSATADKFTELGRMPAISGKTWNHPVVAGHILLVRNGEEMAAFRLAAEKPAAASTSR
jgi:outer membrane protein assembly factor BamB